MYTPVRYIGLVRCVRVNIIYIGREAHACTWLAVSPTDGEVSVGGLTS